MWRAASSDLPGGARFPRALALAASPEPFVLFVTQLDVASPTSMSRELLVGWAPERGAPVAILPALDRVSAPAVASDRDGWLVGAVTGDAGRLAVEVRRVVGREAAAGDALPLETEAGAVALCRRRAGGHWLAFECWREGTVEVMVAPVTQGPTIGRPRPVGPASGARRHPALLWDGRSAWAAWVGGAPGTGASAVVLRCLDEEGAPVVVDRGGRWRVGSPSLAAAAPGRVWVAWHTDRRPGREADLTRWIEVRHVVGRKVWRIRCPAPFGDWGATGEDQGLESPALVLAPGRGLTLLARSSQRLRRFDLVRGGFGISRPVDPEGWGCRAQRPAACAEPGGRVLVAYRDRSDLVIDRLDPAPPAGLPSMAPSGPRPCAGRAAAGRRSPARPRVAGYLVCFGDIHQHSSHSDGTGSAREVYERARDLYRDDVVALTDHESFLGKRIGPGEWRALMAECDLHDEPGRLATVPGYEWTGARHPGPGHRCVYLPRSDLPLLGRDHPSARTSRALVASIGRLGGLVFPHHVGWTGADPEAHDPRVQTCWEIVSCHGAYESADERAVGRRTPLLEGHMARDQLDRGLRFGFVGGSDGHGLAWHHGISRKRDSHRTGLTALLVPRLDRVAVLEALRARRCYATTGVRMLLWLEVEGAPMGAEVAAPGRATARVLAECDAAIARAELVLPFGARVVLSHGGGSVRATVPLPSLPASGPGYVYLRVEQVDGEVGWTSPVWVTRSVSS